MAEANDGASPGTVSGADEPIRAALLSADRLADEARGIAAVQRWTTQGTLKTTPLLPLVERAAVSLFSDNEELARAAMETSSAAPAAEWLLDNFYLIEEQILLVQIGRASCRERV